MKTKNLLFVCLIFSAPVWALFCPSNFTSINLGDSLEQVLQQCGNPRAQNNYKKQPPTTQEWNYYINARPYLGQPSAKMKVLLKDNRIIDMTVIQDNAISVANCTSTIQNLNHPQAIQASCSHLVNAEHQNVTSTPICGAIISVGDSADKVEAACGKPTFINQYAQDTAAPADIVELQYDGPPPVTLVFENGKLLDRKL